MQQWKKISGSKNGARHVKKSRGLLCKTTKVKYRFIQDSPEYPVAKWARMLEIERTGYYNWLRNHERLEKYEPHLKKKIKDVFKESRFTYGPDRIVKEFRKKGEHIGRKSLRSNRLAEVA